MAFPSNPIIGQRFTAENNQEYIWTAKGGWRSLSPSGSRVKQVPYTASAVAPVSPKLGDQWFDVVALELKTWANNGEFSFWRTVAAASAFEDFSKLRLTAERTLPLMWAYSEQNFTFESWSSEPTFSWRDLDPIAVKRVTARDDTVELATTVGIERGKRYVIESSGVTVAVVDVIAILSPTIVRARVDFTVEVTEAQNATFSRTSLDVKAGYATASNGDVLFTKPLTVIQPNFKGRVRLRRSAEGTGTFALGARTPGTDTFVPLVLLETVTPSVGYRDEIYAQDITGPVELSLQYTNTTGRRERIEHLMMYPLPQAVDQRRVERPINVTPADQEINVGVTPTLTGNTFRSLYNLTQNGAEFQVALDAAFTNLIVNSSSDFLASWVATANPGTISDAVYTDSLTLLEVGASGRLVKSADGGKTFVTLTPAGGITSGINGVDYAEGSAVIVGDNGVIQYSTDLTTFTAVSAAGGYTGAFNGVALAGAYGLAVGGFGEIQRTVNNKGGIYAKAPADNGYIGTFVEVTLLANGRAIAVGTSGEIQTSSDFGATWRKRTQAAAFAGAFTAVHLQANGYAVAVGSPGEIQTSDDFGATWTRRVAAGGYTGNFQHVKVFGRYAVAVGSNGEIQTSDNYGATWSKRTTPGGAATNTLNTVAFTPNGDGAYLAGVAVAYKPLKLEGNVISYTVPSGENLLEISKVYYWRVRYQDAAGFWSEYSKPTVFATKSTVNAVSAPVNLSPAKDATNISIRPTLQATAFAFVGDADTHNGSQWQVSQGAQFGTVLYDSGTVAAGTSFTIPSANQLVDRQTYTWRVRYRGVNNGWGGWSTPTSFVASAKVYTPSILSISELNNVFTLNASTFSSPVSGDALESMTVEIAKSPTFGADTIRTVGVPTSRADLPRHVNNVDGPTSLQPDTLYYFQISYRGTIGTQSDKSEVVSFRTAKLPVVGEAVYTTPGTYEFTVPGGVTSVSVVCVGAGSSFGNSIPPGQAFGGSSSFGSFLTAEGGRGQAGGRPVGHDGGGKGGDGGGTLYSSSTGGAASILSGGGGAGGYTGDGGRGGDGSQRSDLPGSPGQPGTGGGGGGGAGCRNGGSGAGSGGGVGLYGQGANGPGGTASANWGEGGGGGSGGASGGTNKEGGRYGGAANGDSGGGGALGWKNNIPVTQGQKISVVVGFPGNTTHTGGSGAVRVIWGPNRSFPNNAA